MKPIALDAMGGDRAPSATVAGALLAAREGIPVLLVGQILALQQELKKQGGDLPIQDATEFITMDDHAPMSARSAGPASTCAWNC